MPAPRRQRHELGDDVANGVHKAHGPGSQHAHGDGRVHVSSGHAAISKDEDHDGQPGRKGDRGDPAETGAIADHGTGASADEHQRERGDEFGDELGCKGVGHLLISSQPRAVPQSKQRRAGEHYPCLDGCIRALSGAKSAPC
jgi:hypothetical protein